MRTISENDDTNLNKRMVVPSISEQLYLKMEICKCVKDKMSSEMLLHEKVQQYKHTPNFQQSFCDMETVPHLPSQVTVEVTMACEPDLVPTLPTKILDNLVLHKDEDGEEAKCFAADLNVAYSPEVLFSNISPGIDRNAAHTCGATNSRRTERIMRGKGEEMPSNFSFAARGIKNLFFPQSTCLLGMPPENDFGKINKVNCSNTMPSLDQEQANTIPETKPIVISKQQSKSYAKMKITGKNTVAPRMQTPCKSLERTVADSTLQEQQGCNSLAKSLSMRQKPKQIRNDMHIKEKREVSTSISHMDKMKPESLPSFESFIVEVEEGSGGYGTVYKARRKIDGITVAIKCPHSNVNRHDIYNELKMLERFGGKNFIIKYEGCFNNGNSDCIVLEHVEHDRPEVLKKEIDMFQLRWYAYCMFRALSSLHKHGVVHRDVKPGNFLFSRKVNRGCLIDFNLAKDLHQKSGTTNKSKPSHDVSSCPETIPSYKSFPPRKMRKFLSKQESAKGFKKSMEKNLNEKTMGQKKTHSDLNNWTINKSQGGDGSGITSTKDVTSTRNPAKRAREPMPCQGRKELINLVHEAIQSPNYEALPVTAPLRKRVAAHPEHMERKFVYQGPMPLHSRGFGVMSGGLAKNKVDRKKMDGFCAGTKGFRAPEVLFRSLYQGTKLDIWSAGVTLLFLMIGRVPFSGDPEQNIKEIVKFRGSEDLWEVAKLHDRESSFPMLYDTQFLPSMKLRDWCEANTKRPDMLKVIPRSLFDLVDKCLTVNPRVRISADEALRHEFYAPCHDALTKRRVLRQEPSLDSGTRRLSHGTEHNPTCEGLL